MQHARGSDGVGPQRARQGPVRGDALGDRKTGFRVVDGRLKRLLQRHGAEAPQHLVPSPRRSRHRDRQDAVARHAGAGPPVLGIPGVAERIHARERLSGRRLPARVQGVELVLLRDVNDGEQVAGDADVHRFDEVEHRSGRDRGIDRVAASLQDVEPHLGGKRLARRHHAIPRHDFRASLREPAGRSIAGDRGAPRRLRRRVAGRHGRLGDQERACADGENNDAQRQQRAASHAASP